MCQRSFVLRTVLIVAGMASWCSAVAADEPSPTPVLGTASSGQKPTRTPIVIDNETLRKYSDQGHVTTVERPASPSSLQTGSGTALAGGMGRESDSSEAAKRRYWRTLYEQQLRLVQSLEQQIEILDREIPGLWRDFYARDDPMYRDGVIKPKLDEALVRRGELEEQLNEERAKLPKIREDARRDGAKPGWFRGLDKPAPVDQDQDRPPEPRLPSDFDVEVVEPDET